MHKWYMAEVPSDTRVWLRTPLVEEPGRGLMGRPRLHRRVRRTASAPEELRALVVSLPKAAWHRRLLHEGSKGPLRADFALLRVTLIHDRLPAVRQWLVCRRSLGPQLEVKFYLSNAPSHCATQELIRISGLRWPIETTLEEAKGEVGMDHFETRTWLAWHHHMFQTFLAHLFLMRLRLLFKKNFRPSPRLRLGNWWLPALQKKLSCPVTTYPRSTTINNETIKPTAPIANTLIRSTMHRLPSALAAKRRSNMKRRCSAKVNSIFFKPLFNAK